MKKCILLIVSIFCFTTAIAQQILVLEKSTNQPISGVSIYNLDKSKMTSTDLDGIANLNDFESGEIIIFQNILYQLKSLSKTAILENNSVVHLSVKIENLGEVVISASKFEQSRRDIPQTILSIDAQDIKFSNPQTSADLVESSGNVFVQKSQLGGGSPMIRGFSTNRLLITIDGVRMNNAIFRGGNLQNIISIDPFAIQNTEITLGAGSIVYGSDAVGGVMSFYSKNPILSASDSLFVNAEATLRYSSANNEKTANASFNFGLEKWAFLTNITYSDFEDLKMGGNGPDDYLRPEYVVRRNGEDIIVQNDEPRVQKPTGYDQINLMQKVRFDPNKDLSMDLGVFYSTTSDYSRYDRLVRYIDDNLLSAEWYYGPQRWFMANYQLTKLSSTSNLYDKIQTTLAYQNFQESRGDRDFQSPIRNIREEAVDAFTFNLDFEKSLSQGLEFYYGLEYVYNKVTSTGTEENIDTDELSPALSRYPNGSDWQSMAIYSSLKYKPSERFVFQTGLRYNHILASADFTENNEFLMLPFDSAKIDAGALTATGGVSYFPSNVVQLRANLSSAFRAPNIDDIGKVFDSEPGSVVVPNPNIKPEYAYGADVGMRLDFDKKLIFDSSVFYTYLDDALVRRDFTVNGQSQIEYDGELSNVQAIQNASMADIYGLELALQYQFNDQLQLRSQYNIIRGAENDNGDEVPVRHVAPDFGNTHLVWSNDRITLDAFAVYNAEFSFEDLAPSEVDKDFIYALDDNGNPYSPSWLTLNLRTQYQFNDDLSMILSLENLTDERYKPYSSGIAAAGRNFIISLNYLL